MPAIKLEKQWIVKIHVSVHSHNPHISMNNCCHTERPRQHWNCCTSLSIWRNQPAGVNYLIFQDPGTDSFTAMHVLSTDHVYVGEIEKSLTTCYAHLTHTLVFMSQSDSDLFLRLSHSILPCVNRKPHSTLIIL